MARTPRGAHSGNGSTRPASMMTRTTGAYVLRFTPGAAKDGLKALTSQGLRSASAAELRRADAGTGLAGAEMIYFERFGIVIVEQEPQRLRAAIAAADANRVLANRRPERVFRTLAEIAPSPIRPAPDLGVGRAGLDRDYVVGYRDAVNDLVDRLMREDVAMAAREVEETTATWGLEACRVPASPFSGAGIKVAVLDTGMDLGHRDFMGRTIESMSFIPNETVDDGDGHGTHCIGTALGPKAPGGVPRYGVAFGADIHAGKVLSNDGSGSDRSIIGGMEWALDQGCEVISMSLGSSVEPGETWFEDYEQIGDICLDQGCLVIAAAGNDSRRPHVVAPVNAPANSPSIMAVAAVDAGLHVARFSCGAINPDQNVDVAAPGVDVLSAAPGGGHTTKSGTSMATPHVAGIAALYAEADAKFRGRALWAILMQRARTLPLPASDVGRGLVQAPG